MGMRLYWADDIEGVLHWDFSDHWTWEEYHDGVKQLLAMSTAAQWERVDIIVDMTPSAGIPPGLVRNVLAGNPEPGEDTSGWGVTVLVGGGTLIRAGLAILRSLSSVIREHYTLAKSVDQARQIIEASRQQSTVGA